MSRGVGSGSTGSGLPFELPALRPDEPPPVWTGGEFLAGERHLPVVAYDGGPSGWSDELTALHEDEVAGGSHFIDIASRRRAIGNLVRHGFDPQGSVLEIGVSGGHLLADLKRHFPQATVIGGDYTIGTLEALARKMPGIPLIRLDLTRSPLPDAAVEAIVLLNVLEHIERDDEALGQVHRMLKPGGLAVIEVPAGPALYDDYDRELMHFRRYSAKELARKAMAAGFEPVEQSHLGALLYPAFWASKKWARRGGKASATDAAAESSRVRSAIRSTARANGFGRWLMRREAALADRMKLPFGIRCILVGRKP